MTSSRGFPAAFAAMAAVFFLIPAVFIAAAAADPPAAAQQRASCAAAGEQILAGNQVRSAVYQEQFTRYSPRTSRCFVEMRIERKAAGEHSNRIGRFLYDGVTKELLAFAETRNGEKSGRVFDLNHGTTTFANGGWDDASSYIDTMMTAGER